jgi:protein gp37
MGETSIEWTDRVWNCVRGCTRVSKGCTNCYAMRQAHRMSGAGQPYEGLTRIGPTGPVWTGAVRCVPELLGEPLRWRKPALVFVNSMSDLFHEAVPDSFIDRVFAVMAACQRHTFQILTKRADRMAAYVNESLKESGRWDKMLYDGRFPWPGKLSDADDPDGDVAYRRLTEEVPLKNVWLGVSVENQETADARVPYLLKTPAAVRFLSVEPMIGPVHLGLWRVEIPKHREHWPAERVRNFWVIAGGESGHGARPVHPEWVRSVRDQFVTAGVPFFFKQWGAWRPDGQGMPFLVDVCGGRGSHLSRAMLPDGRHMPDLTGRGANGDDTVIVRRLGKKAAGRLLDGRTWDELPAGLNREVVR